jgi:hypothetical protein
MVLACPHEKNCPIIFGRPFLHTIGAKINLPKKLSLISRAGEKLKFNFSKFVDKHWEREPIVKDEVLILPMHLSDVVERYMLNQDKSFSREEREALEQEFRHQPPILQLNIPLDDLGKSPPPKAKPSFELKHLLEHLKYTYLDDKRRINYLILLLVLTFQIKMRINCLMF